ncbi:MAG: nitrogen fixation protein NifM [Chromatiaceae bacterium]|jgi:peptidyl-prolyl cis-trans isomerase C|nr:nitrogen fixation protein NifM [Chromatiaceae bacterium]
MTMLADTSPERADPPHDRPPEHRYHLLRAALAAGLSGLDGLEGARLASIARQADKSFDLESLVLGSIEAAEVIIPPGRLDDAVSEVQGRYPDRESFNADLAGNGLDESTLHHALHRELIFDAVMRRVAARRPAVSELDERLFFELHKDRFTQPERRTARHILITINEEFADNRRAVARARIERLADSLGGRAKRFPSLARKHSECPSALDDGRLGTLCRGQLYRTLDAALFDLQEGAVSRPLESELGFHLLWCEKVHRERSAAFSKVRARIRQTLEERAGRNCQKAWIAQLRRADGRRSGSVAAVG